MTRGGAASVPVRIRVDPVACDAYGYCAELFPERITLDEWGYPIIDGAPIEAELLELARRAAAECPRRALVLDGASGRGRRGGRSQAQGS
jgi:ferredoxin